MITIKKIIIVLCICFLFSACEKHEITYEQYTFERSIAYAYYYTEADTNNFGGVTGYDCYLKYGIIETNGEIVNYQDYINYEYFDIHKINYSDRNYVLYTVKRTIDHTANKTYDEIVGYDFYFTDDILRNIGG